MALNLVCRQPDLIRVTQACVGLQQKQNKVGPAGLEPATNGL